MSSWYSEENLKTSWRFVRHDIRDNFTFDVINHEDVKTNIEVVISSLSSQLASNRYYPAPLLKVGVPKSEYSVRPGTVVKGEKSEAAGREANPNALEAVADGRRLRKARANI